MSDPERSSSSSSSMSMSDPERRSSSSSPMSMSDPERLLSEEDPVQRMLSDPERIILSDDDLVAKTHLSDGSVDKPTSSSSEEKSNGDDGPNYVYVSKMKIVLIAKKKKEDTTEEEESSESVRTLESLLNDINRLASAIQKEEKEESERVQLVKILKRYAKDAYKKEELGWVPETIRVDGFSHLESMELLNIRCYVVEDFFLDELLSNLENKKPEFKKIPIIIFSVEDGKKWQEIFWGDEIVNDFGERDAILDNVLNKAFQDKNEGNDQHNIAGDDDDDDDAEGGSDHAAARDDEAISGDRDDHDEHINAVAGDDDEGISGDRDAAESDDDNKD